jgi:hypothetical protein
MSASPVARKLSVRQRAVVSSLPSAAVRDVVVPRMAVLHPFGSTRSSFSVEKRIEHSGST